MIKAIAEKKINSLFYLGINDIKEFPKEKDLIEGHYLKFDFIYIEKINHILYSIINEIDKILSKEYNLPLLRL
ncbi:hypothetical protein [Elizabethkingia anophelis]|uniref:hypothetical protein n=1 Tax=Elizabethkingia anophelis TaxID=1117645 RepID=UPI0013714F8A|nr:hypothetical protein [Elizabethkingia anophelis]MYY25882.1 hypothetical protein [Elizabethkingia anophelis]